jgi:hypothetical protein
MWLRTQCSPILERRQRPTDCQSCALTSGHAPSLGLARRATARRHDDGKWSSGPGRRRSNSALVLDTCNHSTWAPSTRLWWVLVLFLVLEMALVPTVFGWVNPSKRMQFRACGYRLSPLHRPCWTPDPLAPFRSATNLTMMTVNNDFIDIDGIGNDENNERLLNSALMDDLSWRVQKLRLEEENTKRFLRSGPRFLPYEDCRKWVQAWGSRWTSEKEWKSWIANGEKRNAYIPSRPEEYYRKLGKWVSWEHFLGTGKPESTPQPDAKKHAKDDEESDQTGPCHI